MITMKTTMIIIMIQITVMQSDLINMIVSGTESDSDN